MLYHYYLAQGWILLSYADMPLKDYEWWLSSKIANSWNQAPATMETPAAGTSGILMQNNLIMFAGEPQQQEQQQDFYGTNGSSHSQFSQTGNFASQPETHSPPTMYQSQSTMYQSQPMMHQSQPMMHQSQPMMHQSQQATPQQTIFLSQPMYHQQQSNFPSLQRITTQPQNVTIPQWNQQFSESGGTSGDMWATTSNDQNASIPFQSGCQLLNTAIAGGGASNEQNDHQFDAQHGAGGSRSNLLPLLTPLSGQAGMVSSAQEIQREHQPGRTMHNGIIVTPTRERRVLVGNDYITIPEGLKLMNPYDYTESVILDLQASDTGTLNTFNLRNRACLGEQRNRLYFFKLLFLLNLLYSTPLFFRFLDGNSIVNTNRGFNASTNHGQPTAVLILNDKKNGDDASPKLLNPMQSNTNQSIGAAELQFHIFLPPLFVFLVAYLVLLLIFFFFRQVKTWARSSEESSIS